MIAKLSVRENMAESLRNLYVMHNVKDSDMPENLRIGETEKPGQSDAASREKILFSLVVKSADIIPAEKKALARQIANPESISNVIRQGEQEVYSDKDWARLDVLAKT